MSDDPLDQLSAEFINGPNIVCCNCGEGPIVSLAPPLCAACAENLKDAE